MTYEQLKKAYEEAMKKCSDLETEKAELEKENNELKKSNEDKDLRIEHLTELVLKRNKMLFGRKSEKGKYIYENPGQLSFEGIFNEAEEQTYQKERTNVDSMQRSKRFQEDRSVLLS